MIRNNLNKPLIIVVGYLVFTLLLYVFGPFKWVTYNPGLFWTLNILYIIALILGWQLGINTHVCTRSLAWDVEIVALLRFAIPVNFVFELLFSFRRFDITSFNIGLLISKMSAGIVNMGSAYNTLQTGLSEGVSSSDALGGYAFTIMSMIWTVFGYNILLLGILYFRKITLANRIIVVTTVLLIVFGFLATGTNIGFFRIALIFVVFYYLKTQNNRIASSSRNKRSNTRKMLLLSFFATAVVIVVFDRIMRSRGGVLSWNDSGYNIGGIRINPNSPLFRILPSYLHILLISLSGYLTQGYYGMSVSLRLPWKPGYGVGHSMAIINLLGDAINIPHENTYQYRSAIFGWEEGVRWHTMYSWFANDVTYYGVIIVVLVIGIVSGMAYKDAVVTNNPYAKLVTYYFMLLFVFMPCNNQLFQTLYIMLPFLSAVALWLITRERRIVVLSGE